MTRHADLVTVAGIVTRPRYPRALALGVAVVSAGGCGPIEYLSQVSNRAAKALVAAELVDADKRAPYEYTMASEYYRKAREEAGYGSFQSAIEFGRRSEEMANKARVIAGDPRAAGAETKPTVPAGGEPPR